MRSNRKRPWFRKQNSTWYVCVNGKQRNLGRDKRKAFAEFERQIAAASRHEHANDDADAAATASVRELIAVYRSWVRANLAPTTIARHSYILDSLAAAIPPTLKATALRAYHVQAWIDSQKRLRSQTTIGDYIGRAKAVLNHAVRLGYVDRNPIASMLKPTARVRQEYVPIDLWPRVLELARDEPFRDFLVVMLSSGARPSEMFKFEASHLHDNRLILPIEQSKGRRRSRVVYLPAEDALAIVQRLALTYPRGKLFRNSRGIPWNKNSLNCRFRRLKRKLGMPTLCATTLRHSFAHYRLTSGQDALTVAKLLGHVDTRMLATRYGHLDANVEYMTAAANAVPFAI